MESHSHLITLSDIGMTFLSGDCNGLSSWRLLFNMDNYCYYFLFLMIGRGPAVTDICNFFWAQMTTFVRKIDKIPKNGTEGVDVWYYSAVFLSISRVITYFRKKITFFIRQFPRRLSPKT